MNDLQWALVGQIVHVQIQLRPIKLGDNPRIYTPDGCLQEVAAVTLTQDGITTEMDGQSVRDVHHRHHPQSRYRQSNAISFGFTSHYTKMQNRFGPHMTLGIAGENMIVETDRIWTEDDFALGVALQSPSGERFMMDGVFAIPPCKPFASFCMGQRDIDEERQLVKENLQFLFEGTRGFCAELTEANSYTVTTGFTLWTACPS